MNRIIGCLALAAVFITGCGGGSDAASAPAGNMSSDTVSEVSSTASVSSNVSSVMVVPLSSLSSKASSNSSGAISSMHAIAESSKAAASSTSSVLTVVSSASTSSQSSSLGVIAFTKSVDYVYKGLIMAADPAVIRDNNSTLMMYYTTSIPADDPEEERIVINVVESVDDEAWTPAGKPFDPPEYVESIALDRHASQWDHSLETSFVMKRDDQYLMYYTGYAKGEDADTVGVAYGNIGLAISEDGLTFSRIASEPIVKRDPNGYDATSLYSPSVVEHEGDYYMAYTGFCTDPTVCGHRIGIQMLGAVSDDGISDWTKHEIPIFTAASVPSHWHAQSVGESMMLKAPDGKFYLFFTSFDDEINHRTVIGIARSDDPFGTSGWEVYPEPVIVPEYGWEENEVIAPHVLIEDDRIRLWYHATDGRWVIGYAEAPWPLAW